MRAIGKCIEAKAQLEVRFRELQRRGVERACAAAEKRITNVTEKREVRKESFAEGGPSDDQGARSPTVGG